jgi:periplasmic protein TonB
MTAHPATWDDAQDKLGSAFTRSLVLHVAVVGGLTAYAWLNTSESFGDPNAGGPAVGIEAVASIPLPSRGPANPIANDSEIEAPQEKPEEKPKPEPKKAEPEPDDAVSLLPKQREPKQKLAPKPRLQSFDDVASNQLTTKGAQAVSNPMFSAQSGAGQVGLGMNTTLGTRFGAYSAQIQEITRRNWRVQDVDRSVKNGPPVTVKFEIQRDGKVSSLQLIRRSGIPSLDLSVQNAVENSTYPPLPAEYDRNTATVEFTFELKR